MPLSDQEREDRALMRWFRSLTREQQDLVSISRRPRGYTATHPKRKVGDGRNVHCRYPIHGGRELVWFTNEPGDRARRQAQIAAARHLREHLTPQAEPAMPTERPGTPPTTG